MEDLMYDVLLGLAGLLGSTALGFLAKWLKSLGDLAANKTRLQVLSHLDDVIMDKVTDLYVREVKALKAARADGKLTPEEKAHFKQLAVDAAKDVFSLSTLSALFGANPEAALAARVEKKLLDLKHDNSYYEKKP